MEILKIHPDARLDHSRALVEDVPFSDRIFGHLYLYFSKHIGGYNDVYFTEEMFKTGTEPSILKKIIILW